MKRLPKTALIPSLLVAMLVGSTALAQQDDGASDDPVVIQIGDEQRTLSQFEDRFEIAIRGVAAQQGMPMSDEVRAQLEPLAPRFLEQRAGEIALLSEADARGLEVASAELDQLVAEVRGESDEAEFAQVLESSGIGDLDTLRALLEEGARLDLLRSDVAGEVDVEEEQLREAFEARADDEDVTFEEVRPELAETVRQQLVQQRLVEIAEEADAQTFPDRLPYAAAPEPADPEAE